MEKHEAQSAGIEPTEVNPYVIKVTAEIEVDVLKHRSKSLKKLYGKSFDHVGTVCDWLAESQEKPVLPHLFFIPFSSNLFIVLSLLLL